MSHSSTKTKTEKFSGVSSIPFVQSVERNFVYFVKMGVTGLHSYMCEKGLFPAIQEKIKLLEEIEIWKS